MRKRYVMITGVCLFMAGSPLAMAQDTSAVTTQDEVKVSFPQDVGNKICPVSGEKIGESGMEPVTYEHEGKIYHFCCSMCVDEFKKDPKKYIEKVEEELKAGTEDRSE